MDINRDKRTVIVREGEKKATVKYKDSDVWFIFNAGREKT